MKPNPSNRPNANSGRLLILSDGKPGHVNQSIAFARHLDLDYDISSVAFKWRGGKALSYLFSQAHIYLSALFASDISSGRYAAVVSAGSGTYYANRTLARQLQCKSIAIMLPNGYPFDFDLIVAQQHDNPPSQSNIISIPINLTYVEPQGIVREAPGEKYISLIIGGDSHHCQMDVVLLKKQLETIFPLFPHHKVWLTTSRRTSPVVESMLRQFEYDRAVYYSDEPINPIPDFLQHSDYVFLTADSSSMISEAVSFGQSCVEVLPLSTKAAQNTKLDQLVARLNEQNCLHLFDGHIGHASHKIDLIDALSGVQL